MGSIQSDGTLALIERPLEGPSPRGFDDGVLPDRRGSGETTEVEAALFGCLTSLGIRRLLFKRRTGASSAATSNDHRYSRLPPPRRFGFYGLTPQRSGLDGITTLVVPMILALIPCSFCPFYFYAEHIVVFFLRFNHNFVAEKFLLILIHSFSVGIMLVFISCFFPALSTVLLGFLGIAQYCAVCSQ